MSKLQEKLSRPLEIAMDKLNKINSDIAFHIKEDHQDRLPTTCHTCLNLKQKRLFAQEDIDELKDKNRS